MKNIMPDSMATKSAKPIQIPTSTMLDLMSWSMQKCHITVSCHTQSETKRNFEKPNKGHYTIEILNSEVVPPVKFQHVQTAVRSSTRLFNLMSWSMQKCHITVLCHTRTQSETKRNFEKPNKGHYTIEILNSELVPPVKFQHVQTAVRSSTRLFFYIIFFFSFTFW
jgi:hypothetical protein